jgi:hypothetical protein
VLYLSLAKKITKQKINPKPSLLAKRNLPMSLDARVHYDEVVSELTATSGKMFSMPCLKMNGQVFAGFYRGAMVFKLPLPHLTEALALSGAQLFDPSERGHPWKEWVEVPAEHASQWAMFAREALHYADKGFI